jgi:hypothetical protein
MHDQDKEQHLNVNHALPGKFNERLKQLTFQIPNTYEIQVFKTTRRFFSFFSAGSWLNF